MANVRKYLLIFIFNKLLFNAIALEKCKWNNQKGVPCVTISKTSNTSLYNSQGINKKKGFH